MAMLDIGLPPGLTLSCPRPGEFNPVSVQPLSQTFTEFGEELAKGIITNICETPMDR
jgi:hypothetical protein